MPSVLDAMQAPAGASAALGEPSPVAAAQDRPDRAPERGRSGLLERWMHPLRPLW